MYQNRWRLGLRPGLARGTHDASPDALVVWRGVRPTTLGAFFSRFSTKQTRQLFYQVKTLKLTSVSLPLYVVLGTTSVVFSRPKCNKIVGDGAPPRTPLGSSRHSPRPSSRLGGGKPLPRAHPPRRASTLVSAPLGAEDRR